MKLKRLTACILALLLVCGLAGCGDDFPGKDADFYSADGSVAYYITAEHVPMEPMGTVRAQVTPLTGEDARRITGVLFGDREVYVRDDDLLSRAELVEALALWNGFLEPETFQQITQGMQEDDCRYLKQRLQQTVETYEPLLDRVPEEPDRTKCPWVMEENLQYGFQSLDGELVAEEHRYTLWTTLDSQGNSEYGLCLSPRLDVDGLNSWAWRVQMGSGHIPTEADQQQARDLTAQYLSAMDLGSWVIDGCDLTTEGPYGDWGAIIRVTAVPAFSTGPSLRFADRGQALLQSSATFYFLPGGALLRVYLTNPQRELEAGPPESQFTAEQLQERAQGFFTEMTPENYGGKSPNYDAARVTVEGVRYGLRPIPSPSAVGEYTYVPCVSYVGRYDCRNTFSRLVYGHYADLPDGSNLLLTLDARDGQPLLDEYDWYTHLLMGD